MGPCVQVSGPSVKESVAMTRLLLSVTEAADLAGISRTLAYQWCRDGTWPVVRVGRLGRGVRVPSDGLRRWIESETTGGVDDRVGAVRR